MAPSTVATIEALVDGFPNKPEKIRGLPTFKTLKALKQDLQLNAASVPSNLGGGQLGYLGLILSAPAYATLAGNNANGDPQPFIAPTFPGSVPTIQGVDAVARAAELRKFEADTYAWREYDNVSKALRKLVISAVDDVYINTLKNKITGYNNVTINTLLAHLFLEYGEIDQRDIANNDKRFTEPWDGAEPFEKVISRIDECIEYAEDAKAPYTAQQIMAKVTLMVYDTGLYFDELKLWEQQPAAGKTYAEFCKYIREAQRENRRQQQTSKQSGYGLAVQQLQELTENFANAITNDRNDKLTAEAAQKTADAAHAATIKGLTNQIAQLTKQNREIMAKLSLPVNNFGNIPPTGALGGTATGTRRPKRVPIDEGSYCWTHGYLVTPEHGSLNCRYPKEGHQTTATRENNMGGNERGKPVV